jgi:hypothetical protein
MIAEQMAHVIFSPLLEASEIALQTITRYGHGNPAIACCKIVTVRTNRKWGSF